MVPPSSPTEAGSSSTATPVATPSPIPPPIPVETHPNRIRPTSHSQKSSDPTRLAPEDAYRALSPPRLRPIASLDGSTISTSSAAASAAAAALRPAVASLRAPPAIPPVAARLEQERRNRAVRRKQKPTVWKKLLWVKQRGYPDNYTDPATFLEHLQRNPKFRPYDFWALVADSMVIVQHVCSMVVFVSAYAGIYQDRLSPVAVVVCGTIATVVGWVMWDQWKRQEELVADPKLIDTRPPILNHTTNGDIHKSLNVPLDDKSSTSSSGSGMLKANGLTTRPANGNAKRGLGLSLSTSNLAAKDAENQFLRGQSHHGQSLSKSSFQSISPIDPLGEHNFANMDDSLAKGNGNLLNRVTSFKSHISTNSYQYIPQSPTTLPPTVSPRNQARLKTFKSALLIYFALLGLSPILKSLTKSTSSDSIWALATWLLIINIFFFDYGSQYVPSSTSTQSDSSTKDDLTSPIGDIRSPLSETPFPTDSSARLTMPTITPASTHDPSASVTTPPVTTSRTLLPPNNSYPSSLSTNAAVMASTVLASRLSTTTSVFSLTLFSIQIFGLFPLFRRHLRFKSFTLHTALTVVLVVMASAGLGLILSQSYTHTYGECGFCLAWCGHVALRSMIGIVVGGAVTVFVTGGCAWWLISLQRYKNVVIGPWDPARPILTGGTRGGG